VPENVIATTPLGYLDMLHAMACAGKVLTDSGGVQKEAYLLGVPCITLRDTTEWVETVRDGWNVLAGADREKIVDAVRHFSPGRERSMPFGEVGASGRIAAIISGFPGKSPGNLSSGPATGPQGSGCPGMYVGSCKGVVVPALESASGDLCTWHGRYHAWFAPIPEHFRHGSCMRFLRSGRQPPGSMAGVHGPER